jgi:hypothetical protein
MYNVNYENWQLKINGYEYLAEMVSFYNSPLEFYIKSEDIYIRWLKDSKNNSNGTTIWMLFRGKGNLSKFTYNELLDKFKIWEPYLMINSWDELIKI